MPTLDGKSGLLRRDCLLIGRRIATQLAQAQIEAKRRLAPNLEAKIDHGAVGRQRQPGILISKVCLGRRTHPARFAAGLQQPQERVLSCHQELTIRQCRQARERSMCARQDAARATAGIGPSDNRTPLSQIVSPPRIERPAVPRPSDIWQVAIARTSSSGASCCTCRPRASTASATTGSLPTPTAPRASRRPARSSMSSRLPPPSKSSRMLRRITRVCCLAHAPAVALA
jgi:hypothetical protein